MAVIEVNEKNFEAEVLGSDKIVLADFNADWCGTCQQLKPIIEQIAEERSDIKVVSINIDDEEDLADKYEVLSIPCVVAIKDGKELARSIGLKPKDEILKLLGD